MKHTPGPWIVDSGPYNEQTGKYPPVITNECRDICTVESYFPDAGANAHLIAAAPELLEALKKIASYQSGGIIKEGTPEFDRNIMIHIARAAIARAESGNG